MKVTHFASGLQAYLYGFFKNKRIVLYDTLLEQVSRAARFSSCADRMRGPS